MIIFIKPIKNLDKYDRKSAKLTDKSDQDDEETYLLSGHFVDLLD